MDRLVLAVGIVMGLVFSVGVVTGVIAMIAMAVRREDQRYTLTGQAPGAAARGVRRLVRLGVRDIIPPDVRWKRQ